MSVVQARAAGVRRLRFGHCVLDEGLGSLTAPDGSTSVLRPKTFELLRFLLAKAGRVVPREEILDAIWPGIFVTDDSITQCVVEIRKAMGQGGAGLLKTIPRRGYLLQAEVIEDAPAGAPAAPAIIASHGTPVVAVMPFRVPSGDAELLSVADGVLDGVVGVLATLREPVVISANSTRSLAALSLPLDEVGRRLGSGYIASGTLRRLGGALRLGVELAEAATSAVLSHRTHDIPTNICPKVEDEVAAAIARRLVPGIEEAELRRVRRQAPANWTAWQMLLEARRTMLRLEQASFEEAGLQIRRAIAMDPAHAGGPAALANWYSLRLGQGWSEDREADDAALHEAAEEAVRLDRGQARALALLGHNATLQRRDFATAMEFLGRALEAGPNDAEVWMWSAPTFGFAGQPEEAVRRAERAIRLSPEDPLMFRYEHFLAAAHYEAGNCAEAARAGLASVGRQPRYLSNLRLTSAALVALGRLGEARDLAARAMALEPAYRVAAAMRRHPAAAVQARDRFAGHLRAAGFPD